MSSPLSNVSLCSPLVAPPLSATYPLKTKNAGSTNIPLFDVNHECNEQEQWNMSNEWNEVNCIKEQYNLEFYPSTWHNKL